MTKGCWWSLIGIVAFFALIVFLVLSWSAKNPEPVLSTETPKPGYYEGGAADFTLTADGEIVDFYLQAADTKLMYCVFTWEDQDAYLVDNRYSLAGANDIDIMYATDGQFYIDYSLTLCGQWKVSAKSGRYKAAWIGDKPPSP
jgi:hypothetical protein